jgi:hypothetical protein
MTAARAAMDAWEDHLPTEAVVLDGSASEAVEGRSLVLRLLASPPADPDAVTEAASRIPQLLHILDRRDAPDGGLARLCVLLPRRDDELSRAANALAETLVRYGAGHLAMRPVQVNLLRHPPTSEGLRRAADMVRALFGGRLDGVRGQVFDLSDLGEADA